MIELHQNSFKRDGCDDFHTRIHHNTRTGDYFLSCNCGGKLTAEEVAVLKLAYSSSWRIYATVIDATGVCVYSYGLKLK